MSNTVLILNGPGLAALGDYHDRWDESLTLDAIRGDCAKHCAELGLVPDFRQTDDPTVLLEWIAEGADGFGALIVNPGSAARSTAGTAPSLRAAIEALVLRKRPVFEVHLDNLFRRNGPAVAGSDRPIGAMGLVCGLGRHGYRLALTAAARRLVTGPAT
jgi:3-dehydroquinate dehydratase-2